MTSCVFFLLFVKHRKNTRGRSETALEVSVDIGELFQRSQQHDHRRQHGRKGSRRQLLNHTREAGKNKHRRKTQRRDKLNHRGTNCTNINQLHVLLSGRFIHRAERSASCFLAFEHHDNLMTIDHLLGSRSHVAHGGLNFATHFAELARND